MKQFKLLTLICMIFMPFMVLADDENKTWEKALKAPEEGSLFALKNPNVTADIVFDYTNCMINRKTFLLGVDSAGDEMTATLLSNMGKGEDHFVTWYNQEYSNKGCSLIYNGSDSPYRVEICLYDYWLIETKFIMTQRSLMLRGWINVYKNDDGTMIAKKKFNINIQERGNPKSKNYSDVPAHLIVGYEVLADELAKKIKKSKKPKE